MAEKTLLTRIKLKYGTYTEWTQANPVLLAGELAVVVVPGSSGAVVQEPALLFKVGDGESTFTQLPFGSGLAADVHNWAKAASKPTYAAEEITGLDAYISGQIKDTDTQYQVVRVSDSSFKLQSKPKEGGEWSDVGSPISIVYTLTEGTANGTVKFNGTDVKVHGLGSAAYTGTEAFEAAGAVEAAISALKADEVAASTGEMLVSISQTNGVIKVTKRAITEADIPALSMTKITGLESALAGKQDKLTFNTAYDPSSNKAATMADITAAVEGLSGAMHYVGESTTDPGTGTVTIEAKPEYSAQSGDVVTYQKKEYVYDGSAWRELGDEGSYAVKGSISNSDIASDANIDQSKIAGLVAALEDITTKLGNTAVAAQITAALQALDVSDSAAAQQFVTAVAQADGRISVTRRALQAADIPQLPASNITGLADIAKTGNVSDLQQTPGTYVVFDCGTASTNI